jgi:hypothetical protein
MKLPKTITLFFLGTLFLLCFPSCKSLFAPKYGCPSDGRNIGAERILSGEKVPKAGKFKG